MYGWRSQSWCAATIDKNPQILTVRLSKRIKTSEQGSACEIDAMPNYTATGTRQVGHLFIYYMSSVTVFRFFTFQYH